MRTIEISSWNVGCKKVSHTQLIRQRAGLSLSQAKAITDAVLDGHKPRMDLPSEAVARKLVLELSDIGFVASLIEVDRA